MANFDAKELLAPLSGWRRVQDQLTNITITAGGLAVLAAILLICFYLLYEVIPLFKPASIEPIAQYTVAGDAKPLYMTMEEHGEVAFILTADSGYQFFNTQTGQSVHSGELDSSVTLKQFALSSEQQSSFAVADMQGAIQIAKPHYELFYGNDTRTIQPKLNILYTDTLIDFNQPLNQLAFRESDQQLTLVAADDTNQLLIKQYNKEEDFITEDITLVEATVSLPVINVAPDFLLISPLQQWLYVIAKTGDYEVISLRKASIVDSGSLGHSAISDVRFLLGGISLLVAKKTGDIEQWFLTAENTQPTLSHVRTFDTDVATARQLLPEHRRKGFSAISEKGELDIYYSTSKRHLLNQPIAQNTLLISSLAPRANYFLSIDQQWQAQFYKIHNEHPEISWSVLWNKIWYENYQQPAYIWQSSAANNDFEPKYSFMPLAFGTLKAAFYAMLIATPLAICGAIYTAYFMGAPLRRKIKPLIELMEALPTVILGFLAGLWLAPIIENNLAGFFSIFIILPLGVLITAFAWSRIPPRLTFRLPLGTPALLLIPVCLLLIAVSLALGDTFDAWFFNGDMRQWITHELGINYDQRNALVVGIAMGFAVIPTIFSITEDAIFAVPKSISYGSLALGANQWQTLLRVVLPTASPGIFSALMIGMGRAVGETMIVLMATGNTAIMDANIFEGMRTLSANIAVEIGETEVDSSHYRVLFLAAFVLFLFTFAVNTVAEIVRHRLRKRYGSL